MTPPRRIVWRTLIGTAAATHALPRPGRGDHDGVGARPGQQRDAARGAFATVSFQVPNESTTGAPTTALTVDLPNVSAVRTETKPGWAAKIDRDAATNASAR